MSTPLYRNLGSRKLWFVCAVAVPLLTVTMIAIKASADQIEPRLPLTSESVENLRVCTPGVAIPIGTFGSANVSPDRENGGSERRSAPARGRCRRRGRDGKH